MAAPSQADTEKSTLKALETSSLTLAKADAGADTGADTAAGEMDITDSKVTETTSKNADAPRSGAAKAPGKKKEKHHDIGAIHDPALSDPALPSKHDSGWRMIVRNFTPSWFSITMGTGIVSIILHNLPYNADWVRYISIVVFCLNIGLFCAFTLISLVRYTLYPEIWGVMIKHSTQSLFIGTVPMGLATIINMIIFVCAPWGNWAIYLAWALWWVDVVLSCACSFIVPFIIVHHHKNQLINLTAGLLLPIVPVIVASASGGVIAEVLPNHSHAVTTVVTSYILWGMGQAFAFHVMTIYFLRLQLHDLPPREVIVSVFLPIGPLGQGGFALQQLGKVVLALYPANGTLSSDGSNAALGAAAQYGGVVLYVLGALVAFMMWGAALGWLALALFSIHATKSFPFNMGWWGFTFPLGVFTTCTGLMATELSSGFLKVLTMIFSMSVLLLWIMVSVMTILQIIQGKMFYAPCLKDLRRKAEQAGGDRTV